MRKKISELTEVEQKAWKAKKRLGNIKARFATVVCCALVAIFRDNKPILMLLLIGAVIFLVWAVYVTLCERISGVEISSLNIKNDDLNEEDTDLK